MAKIVEDSVTIVFSRLVKDSDADAVTPVLDEEQLETLQQAVEGLVNNSSIVVEIAGN